MNSSVSLIHRFDPPIKSKIPRTEERRSDLVLPVLLLSIVEGMTPMTPQVVTTPSSLMSQGLHLLIHTVYVTSLTDPYRMGRTTYSPVPSVHILLVSGVSVRFKSIRTTLVDTLTISTLDTGEHTRLSKGVF